MSDIEDLEKPTLPTAVDVVAPEVFEVPGAVGDDGMPGWELHIPPPEDVPPGSRDEGDDESPPGSRDEDTDPRDLALESAVGLHKAQQLADIFASVEPRATRNLDVLELMKKTRLKRETVEGNLERLRAATRSSYDIQKWREENPWLADEILAKPELVKALSDDSIPVKGFKAIWRTIAMMGEDTPIPQKVIDEGLGAYLFDKPRETLAVKAQPGEKGFFNALAGSTAQSFKQAEISARGFELMQAKLRGQETFDLETKIAELKGEAQVVDYGDELLTNLARDTGNLLGSEASSMAAGGAAAAGGAVVGGALGALFGPEGAWGGAKVGAALAGKAGVFAASFVQESGSSYLDMGDEKDDAGKPIDEQVKAGAAILYGLVAAAIEVDVLGEQLKNFGGFGKAVKEGDKTVAKAVFKDKRVWPLLRELAKRALISGYQEGKQESLQSLAQSIITYGGQTISAGKYQEPHPETAIAQAMEEGWSTFKGMLLPAVVGLGPKVAMERMAIDRAQRTQLISDLQAAVVAQTAEHPTAQALPDEFERIIAAASSQHGLPPAESVHVDPQAAQVYFQGHPEQLEPLLGEDGQEKLDAALAGGTKLEVPMGDFLSKWGKAGALKELAGDFATQPEALTPNEFQRELPMLERQAEELAQTQKAEPGAAEDAKQNPEKQAVLNQKLHELHQALRESGEGKRGLSKKDADADVILWRRALETTAARYGVDVNELAERTVPRIIAHADASQLGLAAQDALTQGDRAGQKNQPRGWMRRVQEGVGRMFEVALTDKADKSTFLHESAHVFLEMLADIAAEPDAHEDAKSEWATVVNALGISDRSELKAKHHEQFADGFEGYLLNNKAPSKKLAAAFQRFKDWLLKVYKGIRAKGQPSEELSGIFDRLLATDEELEQAKTDMGQTASILPLLGLPPEEVQKHLDDRAKAESHASHQLTRNALLEEKRRKESWWRAEEKAEREFVAQGWFNLPEVRALEDLKGLGRNIAKLMKGEQTDAEIVLNEHVAEKWGYPTSQAMIEAIRSMPTQKQWIEQTARQRMEARYGSVLTDIAQLREKAQDALHGPLNATAMFRELSALRKTVGGSITPLEAFALAAKKVVGSNIIQRLSPGAALAAERKASNLAFREAARGNFPKALVHKQQQILNHFIYRELRDAVDRRDKLDRLLSRMETPAARKRLGQSGVVYLDAVDAIVGALGRGGDQVIGLGTRDPAAIDELTAHLRDRGDKLAGSQELRQLVLNPRPWKRLTVDQMNTVDQALRQIHHFSVEQLETIKAGEKIAVEKLVEELVAQAVERYPEMLKPQPEGQPKKLSLKNLNWSTTRPEVIFGKLGQLWKDFFWDWHLEARNAEFHLANKISDQFTDMWFKLGEEQKNLHDKVDATKLPLPDNLKADLGEERTRAWAIMLALNAGTQSNLERLLGGYQWEEQQVRGFLNDTLTEKEWHFVQGVFDLLESLRPEIERVYEAVNGIKPKMLAPLSFQTKYGTFKGGYFPARYNPLVSEVGLRQSEELSTVQMNMGAKISVAKGFTNERAKNYSDVVSLAWNTVPVHIASVVHYVTHEQYIREASKLLQHPKVKQVITQRLGPEAYVHLKSFLMSDASALADSVGADVAEVTRALGAMRNRFTMSRLGYSMSLALGNLVDPFVAWASGDIKAKYLWPAYAKALARHATDGIIRLTSLNRRRGELLSDNAKESVDLAMRHESGVKKMRRITRLPGYQAKLLDPVLEHAWVFTDAVDRLTSTVMWEATYAQSVDEGMDHEAASKRADEVVRLRLPVAHFSENPTMMRKQQFAALMGFMSYHNTIWNTLRELWGPDTTHFEAAWRSLAVLGVAYVLAEIPNGRGPEDDEKNAIGLAKWTGRKAVAGALNMIPIFGGDLANQFESKLAGKRPSIRSIGPISWVESFAVQAPSQAAKHIEKGQYLDAAFDVAAGAASFRGLPVKPIGVAKYLAHVATGETEPSGPLDVASKVTFGDYAGQPANPFSLISDAINQ